MKNRTYLMFVLASLAYGTAPIAVAAYKCATKAGVSYQDKPCVEAMQPAELHVVSAKDAERQRNAQKAPKPESDRAQEGPKTQLEQRKADEAEWLERSARKADSLKRCATGEVRCNASSIRVAAMYLSENQLESALGAPAEKLVVGLQSSSEWKVRVSNDGGPVSAKLIAAWGLCSDDKDYFASGQGPRACKVNIE